MVCVNYFLIFLPLTMYMPFGSPWSAVMASTCLRMSLPSTVHTSTDSALPLTASPEAMPVSSLLMTMLKVLEPALALRYARNAGMAAFAVAVANDVPYLLRIILPVAFPAGLLTKVP